MREVDRLADLVERVVDGDPWHGSNLTVLLDDLTGTTAAVVPVPGGHSVWQLVLHMTGWTTEALARLDGAAAGEPVGGDWPAVPAEATDQAWRQAVHRLVAAHRRLAAALRASDDAVLDGPVLDHRNRAAGTGLSQYLTLHGLVHHTVYHSGQVAVLRRLLKHPA